MALETTNKYDIGKLTAYVVPSLIFFGVFRLTLYYSHFNVNILPFLDFSEILTSFFDIIIFVIIFVVLVLFILLMRVGTDYNRNQPFKLILRNPSKWDWSLIAFPFVIFLLNLFIKALTKQYTVDYLGIAGIYIFLLGGLILYYLIKKKSMKEPRDLTFIISYFAMTTFFILYLLVKFDTQDVKQNAWYYGVEVEYNSGAKFRSDSSKYYIGNTRNFLFIYDERSKVTTIEKLEDVKALKFPEPRRDARTMNQ